MNVYLPRQLSRNCISDFLARCHRQYPFIANEEYLVPWCDKLAKNAYAVCIVKDDTIEAACFYYLNDDVKIGYITLIAVLSEHRSGVGGAIIDRCLDDLKTRGASKVRLEVLRSNVAAFTFYIHHGFVVIEERNDKFLMEKTLS